MKVKFNVCLCDDEDTRFFGEGPYRLLCGIRDYGSLRTAAQNMGMAYTKAFGLIKRAETTLGFSLTQRTIGGKGGGGSVLTEGAKELMMRYEAYKTACEQMAENLYNTHFSSFQPPKFADAENKDTEQ